MENMKHHQNPFQIEFSQHGDPTIGFISVAEKDKLTFVPKRVYWTYYTPDDVCRGGHAHWQLEQIMIAVAGKIELTIEMHNGQVFEYVLDSPRQGVFIPKMSWHTMKYSRNAVQVCIASMEYDEADYIRSYPDFKKAQP